MAPIVLDGLRKVYPGKPPVVALEHLDLTIDDGELVAFVGPSGCGKSTVLRCVAGLEKLSAGRVIIGDREVQELPPGKRDIAMVFQSYALYPHLTVYKNLAFPLKERHVPRAARHRGAPRRRDARAHTAAAPPARATVGRPTPTRGDGPCART